MTDPQRILVLANETISGAALREELIAAVAEGPIHVHVVAPALSSRMRFLVSDVDSARQAAQLRLEQTLESLKQAGIQATGRVGDSDPVRAFKDELETDKPDRVVISTHPPGKSNWLEKNVVEHVRELSDVPVKHIVVDLERESAGSSAE